MHIERAFVAPRATQELLRGLLLMAALAALAFALAVLPLSVAAGLVAGGAALLLVLARPLLAVVLLILAVPFGSPFAIQIGGFNFGPIEVLFGLMIAAWLGQKVIARDLMGRSNGASHAEDQVVFRAGFRIPLIVWPLAAWLFAAALTLTVTHSLPESLKELLKWSEVLAVVILVTDMVPRSRIPPILALVLIAAAVEALIGLYQTATRSGPEPFFVPLGGQLVMRSYGTFEQPNPFAAYLDFSLPVGVSLLIWFGLELWETRGASWPALARNAVHSSLPPALPGSVGLLVLAAILTLPLIGAAFFFSLSRGAWLGFALAVVVMTALRSRKALLVCAISAFVLVGILILGSLSLLPSALTNRIADVPSFLGLNLFDPRAVVLTDENFGIVDRMAHWFAAWNMFSDFPYLGVGIGNYGVVYPLYGLRDWPHSLGHSHNFYLNMLAETGIVGFVFYSALVFSALAFAWSVSRSTRGIWRAVALGILGALVALSAHNFFDNLYVHGMNIQFGLLLGFLARLKAER
jgi:O-antigen ligase